MRVLIALMLALILAVMLSGKAKPELVDTASILVEPYLSKITQVQRLLYENNSVKLDIYVESDRFSSWNSSPLKWRNVKVFLEFTGLNGVLKVVVSPDIDPIVRDQLREFVDNISYEVALASKLCTSEVGYKKFKNRVSASIYKLALFFLSKLKKLEYAPRTSPRSFVIGVALTIMVTAFVLGWIVYSFLGPFCPMCGEKLKEELLVGGKMKKIMCENCGWFEIVDVVERRQRMRDLKRKFKKFFKRLTQKRVRLLVIVLAIMFGFRVFSVSQVVSWDGNLVWMDGIQLKIMDRGGYVSTLQLEMEPAGIVGRDFLYVFYPELGKYCLYYTNLRSTCVYVDRLSKLVEIPWLWYVDQKGVVYFYDADNEEVVAVDSGLGLTYKVFELRYSLAKKIRKIFTFDGRVLGVEYTKNGSVIWDLGRGKQLSWIKKWHVAQIISEVELKLLDVDTYKESVALLIKSLSSGDEFVYVVGRVCKELLSSSEVMFYKLNGRDFSQVRFAVKNGQIDGLWLIGDEYQESVFKLIK